ncbi:hypothetical protein KUV89_09305 [Marinobacter hydrocarbonoclasticus]|nr:hypothetical protein [Marinobacter nauticus]
MKKVIAVASNGGHWVQLLRLLPALQPEDINISLDFISTEEINVIYQGNSFRSHVVTDCNFSESKRKILPCLFQCCRIVNKIKPDVVVSTGAAPGLLTIFVARLCGAKTIWIDSIANSRKLSLSGRVAKYIASVCLTQWPELADGKRVMHVGSVV